MTTHTHRADLTGFRFTTCKKGHSAVYQRRCLDCAKPFCSECAGIELWPAAAIETGETK